jgi:hypothetical protein
LINSHELFLVLKLMVVFSWGSVVQNKISEFVVMACIIVANPLWHCNVGCLGAEFLALLRNKYNDILGWFINLVYVDRYLSFNWGRRGGPTVIPRSKSNLCGVS